VSRVNYHLRAECAGLTRMQIQESSAPGRAQIRRASKPQAAGDDETTVTVAACEWDSTAGMVYRTPHIIQSEDDLPGAARGWHSIVRRQTSRSRTGALAMD